jgi:hypothetical protein
MWRAYAVCAGRSPRGFNANRSGSGPRKSRTRTGCGAWRRRQWRRPRLMSATATRRYRGGPPVPCSRGRGRGRAKLCPRTLAVCRATHSPTYHPRSWQQPPTRAPASRSGQRKFTACAKVSSSSRACSTTCPRYLAIKARSSTASTATWSRPPSARRVDWSTCRPQTAELSLVGLVQASVWWCWRHSSAYSSRSSCYVRPRERGGRVSTC